MIAISSLSFVAGSPSKLRLCSIAIHIACFVINCQGKCDRTTSRPVSICIIMRQLPLTCALWTAVACLNKRLLASRSTFFAGYRWGIALDDHARYGPQFSRLLRPLLFLRP